MTRSEIAWPRLLALAAASRALLKTGEIDAITTDMTTTLENERLGEEWLLFTFGDLMKDFHMQVIFATDELIAAKPEAVRAFMTAWLETIAFAKANKDKTIKIIRQVLGFDPDILNKSYERLIENYSTDGKFNQRAQPCSPSPTSNSSCSTESRI